MSRLLIIDDEKAFGDFVVKVATQIGLEATATDNAVDFRRLLGEIEPEIIVLDLQIPDVDGLELLHELGQMQCPAKIVLLSGMDTRVLDSACRLGDELGLSMAPPIQKPIRAAALSTALSLLSAQPHVFAAKDLARAISENRLFLVYQPKVDIKTGQMIGVEALVRLKTEDGAIVYPDEFIGLAEETGQIGGLTERVIEQAFPQAAAWQAKGLHLQMAVNLSAKNINDRQLPDRLAQKCRENGISPDMITLELTETAFTTDVLILLEVLSRFRLKGFHLSIDDFGIGYSSISQLLRLPFTEIKVDKSFVTKLDQVRESEVVTKVIIDMAHGLGMSSVAEGVETEPVRKLLEGFGCDIAQGYLFSKPVDPAQIQTLFGAWQGGERHDNSAGRG